MENVLTVTNLKKTYIERKFRNFRFVKTITHAVNDINFSLRKGEILGMLGPNGAGKTTTIQMLLGSLYPTSGTISYFGKKFNGENPEILRRINYSSAYIELPWRMTVWENLDVYARLYTVPNRKERIEKLLKRFGLLEFRDKKVRQLSSGQQTRVVLTKAFLNYPEIVLMDEPTASLDPEISKQVRSFILEQQKEYNVSMIFTSHNMKEVQEICDRIIFIDHGKIVAQDTPLGLVKRFRETKLRFSVEKGETELKTYLNTIVQKFSLEKGKYSFVVDEENIGRILSQLSKNGIHYQDLEVIRPDLEDFFLEMTKK